MKQAFTHIVVKILFDDSTGFGEMRWPLSCQGSRHCI